MKLLSSLLIAAPMSVCLSKVLIVVLRWKITQEQHRHRPRSPSSSWPLGRGIQEISSEQHTLGQTLPQVTISKPYKGFFPRLAFMFQGTASLNFHLPGIWRTWGWPLTGNNQPLASLCSRDTKSPYRPCWSSWSLLTLLGQAPAAFVLSVV